MFIGYWNDTGKQMTSVKMVIIAFAGLVLWTASSIQIFEGSNVFARLGLFGIKPASASSQLGILGQQAPEPELNSWIDENGKPTDPLKLQDYRGKVIYLYFFQDW